MNAAGCLGEFLRKKRLQARHTQADLARAAGISTAELSRLEAGVTSPNGRTWVRLTEALQVNPRHRAWSVFVQGERRCGRIIALADSLLDKGLAAEGAWVIDRANQLNAELYSGRYTGEITRLRGRAAFASGHYEVACQWFDKMVRRSSKASNHRQAIAAYDYGMALVQSSHLIAGLIQLKRARDLFASSSDSDGIGQAHLATATALLNAGDYGASREFYRKSIHILRGSTDGDSYPRLGIAICSLILEGYSHDLLAELRALLDDAPDFLRPRVWYVMGVAERTAGHIEDALTLLDKSFCELQIGSEQWCEIQIERLLCMSTNDISSAKSLWVSIKPMLPSVDDYKATSLAMIGLRLGLAAPGDLEWMTIHHTLRTQPLMTGGLRTM